MCTRKPVRISWVIELWPAGQADWGAGARNDPIARPRHFLPQLPNPPVLQAIKRWRSDKQARDVRGHCRGTLSLYTLQFQVFSHTAGRNNSKHVFLSVVLLFRVKSPGNKNNLRTA